MNICSHHLHKLVKITNNAKTFSFPLIHQLREKPSIDQKFDLNQPAEIQHTNRFITDSAISTQYTKNLEWLDVSECVS